MQNRSRMETQRILLIEDDGLVAMMLERMLEQMGHEVCATAATEVAAVEAAQRCAPSLVIADARLRSGSGISAVEEILRTRRDLPHLFVSGDSSDVKKRLPAAITLQKPFREAALATAIGRALTAAPSL